MSILIAVLLIANLTVVIAGSVVIAKELGELNKNLESMEENIHKDIGTNACSLAWELSEQKKLLSNQLTKNDIKAAVKGELTEEVIKLAFTPIKLR